MGDDFITLSVKRSPRVTESRQFVIRSWDPGAGAGESPRLMRMRNFGGLENSHSPGGGFAIICICLSSSKCTQFHFIWIRLPKADQVYTVINTYASPWVPGIWSGDGGALPLEEGEKEEARDLFPFEGTASGCGWQRPRCTLRGSECVSSFHMLELQALLCVLQWHVFWPGFFLWSRTGGKSGGVSPAGLGSVYDTGSGSQGCYGSGGSVVIWTWCALAWHVP